MRIRLTTYNVHCFPWTAPAIRDIVAWVVSHSDIVALQEIWCRHAEWSAAFAAHGWIFARPARENHIAAVFGSGLAIAWRAAVWRLTDNRFYPFEESSGLDQFVIKGWFRVELQLIAAPTNTLRLINTHMQSDYDVYGQELRHLTEAIRHRQVTQLLAVEQRTLPPMPTLVMGDMNTDNCWFPGGWLLPAHVTAPPVTFPSSAESLDHCTTLGPTSWKVEGFHVSPLALSDHYPVCWFLSMQQAPTTSSQYPPQSAMEPSAYQPQYPHHRSPSHGQ
jgi:endonuclease/exonuclease/phosphatase family metal-dependent hydrolase